MVILPFVLLGWIAAVRYLISTSTLILPNPGPTLGIQKLSPRVVGLDKAESPKAHKYCSESPCAGHERSASHKSSSKNAWLICRCRRLTVNQIPITVSLPILPPTPPRFLVNVPQWDFAGHLICALRTITGFWQHRLIKRVTGQEHPKIVMAGGLPPSIPYQSLFFEIESLLRTRTHQSIQGIQ